MRPITLFNVASPFIKLLPLYDKIFRNTVYPYLLLRYQAFPGHIRQGAKLIRIDPLNLATRIDVTNEDIRRAKPF